MKSIIKYFTLSLLIGLAFSCEDFLDEENKSNITAESYFMDTDGYESLVNASYSTLRDVWGNDPWLFCLGVDIYTRGHSEEIGGSVGNREEYSRQLNEYLNLSPENDFVADFYSACYTAIQTCNTAITRANNVSGMSESKIKMLVGEVRFLRAYYYYLLAEQFGDVPLVTDEITSAVTHFDRVTEESVYQFIISELEASLDKVSVIPEEFGRVTKGAVKNLLSLVHLTRGYKSYADANDFSLAASLADEVINNGTYSLLNSFEEVFISGNENNDEIIFSIQYDPLSLGSDLEGNGQSAQWGWELWTYEPGFERENPTYNWKKSQFMPTQFLYSLFNTSIDSRYDVTFLSTFYATTDDEVLGIKKGDLKIYFPKRDENFTTQDSINFMNEHPVASIYKYETWKQDFNNIGGTNKFPMVWKFYDPNSEFHNNGNNYRGTRDIFLFRLAETYLIAAEAYLKLGDNSTAAERINTVRKRAAIEGKVSQMEIQISNVNLDLILDERARELTGEYKRWMDLKRTGKLIERTLEYNNLTKMENKLKDFNLLRPIPQSVIDHDSGEFLQNPGY
ncbi:MAG: RagB/SusD family nutrient uptake outer membrane protein [Bacteroidales bacterium]|nr:MAG: RagB/SusD family nutrient uptake outer membrane protein [Bacteroidales bacterium]